jgi:hypothetical protein
MGMMRQIARAFGKSGMAGAFWDNRTQQIQTFPTAEEQKLSYDASGLLYTTVLIKDSQGLVQIETFDALQTSPSFCCSHS